jgi:hypothetical protein
MKHLKDILFEGIFDIENNNVIDDFIDRPFQSIFNCGPKIKNQRDWEYYLGLFEKSISAECESSFEHGGDYVYTAEGHKKQWVLSIKNEGPDNRKIIVLYEYKGPYIKSKTAIISTRRFSEKIWLRVGNNAMDQLYIKDQKGTSYILSKKQMKTVEDMLNNWVRGDFQDWLKK